MCVFPNRRDTILWRRPFPFMKIRKTHMQCLYGQVGVCVAALLLSAPAASHAGEKDEAARCTAVRGTLFARAAGAADWTPVAADTALRGPTTLVALFEAELRSPNDAVELTLVGDI